MAPQYGSSSPPRRIQPRSRLFPRASFRLFSFHHPIDASLRHMEHFRDLGHGAFQPPHEETDPRVSELLIDEESMTEIALKSLDFGFDRRRPLKRIPEYTLGRVTSFWMRVGRLAAFEYRVSCLGPPRAVRLHDMQAEPAQSTIFPTGARFKPALEIGWNDNVNLRRRLCRHTTLGPCGQPRR